MCFRSRPRLALPVQVWRRRHRLHQRRLRGSVAERAGHRRPEPLRTTCPTGRRLPAGWPSWLALNNCGRRSAPRHRQAFAAGGGPHETGMA